MSDRPDYLTDPEWLDQATDRVLKRLKDEHGIGPGSNIKENKCVQSGTDSKPSGNGSSSQSSGLDQGSSSDTCSGGDESPSGASTEDLVYQKAKDFMRDQHGDARYSQYTFGEVHNAYISGWNERGIFEPTQSLPKVAPMTIEEWTVKAKAHYLEPYEEPDKLDLDQESQMSHAEVIWLMADFVSNLPRDLAITLTAERESGEIAKLKYILDTTEKESDLAIRTLQKRIAELEHENALFLQSEKIWQDGWGVAGTERIRLEKRTLRLQRELAERDERIVELEAQLAKEKAFREDVALKIIDEELKK